jgi:hypothetical protein
MVEQERQQLPKFYSEAQTLRRNGPLFFHFLPNGMNVLPDSPIFAAIMSLTAEDLDQVDANPRESKADERVGSNHRHGHHHSCLSVLESHVQYRFSSSSLPPSDLGRR